ncbi:ribonuclease H-like domain-containing protein [Tanacetum coccineum]
MPPPIFDPPNPQTNTDPVIEPLRTHPMITWSQSGIVKPIERLSLHTSSLSPISKSPFIALKYPNWPSDVNLVRSMWLFKHKFHADGTLSRYKARLWPIQQLDVKNAFLNGDLFETVYMYQPPGFVDSRYPNHSSQVAYLLLYVDIIILTASSPVLLQQIVDSLHKEFDMTHLGALNYFLGISAVRHPTWLFLSQKKYALQLLERAHMVNYLSYAVQQVCLYMHDPREPHFAALKRIMRYVQGTLKLGLHLYASATTSLVGYTDVDWACFSSTRKSTSGYCVFLGNNLLSWSAKRQHTIYRSSAEVEYQGVANVVAETAWIRNLLLELQSPLLTATLVYCDNVSAVYMSANPVQHQRTKYIEIDIHFVRDMVKVGHVRVLYVPSRFQYVDIFTKGLPSALFEDSRSSLSVRPPPAPTAGAY